MGRIWNTRFDSMDNHCILAGKDCIEQGQKLFTMVYIEPFLLVDNTFRCLGDERQ